MKPCLFSLLLLVASRCFGGVDLIPGTNLPNGTAGTAYSAVVKASGGCTPYKWAIASGTLPIGVTAKVSSTTTSLNLTGTPTTAATYTFAVKVTGCGGHVSKVSYKDVIQAMANPGYLKAPSSLNLGRVLIGSSQTQLLTLSNSGGSSLTISGATLNGAGFRVSGLSFPYALPAGNSATLSVIFDPTGTGTANATLSLNSNASDASVAVALSGTGTSPTGTLAVTPGAVSFGRVNVGTSQSQKGIVSASGGSVTLSSASSGNAQFTLGGLALPLTIAAGQSVSFTVTFAPKATGNASANLSFFSSGARSVTETASGTGATIQHIVDLSWAPSTSPSVSGYNVYRAAAAAGPYSKINPSLKASLNFSDSTVQSGRTYYYVTTAVDSSGVESAYSNQVQAAVPMP